MSSDPDRIAALLSPFTPSVPARIWVKNADGMYVYVNERLVSDFDIPREHWIGSSDEQLFPELARGFRRNDLAVLTSGQPIQTTDLVMRRGGREFAFVLRFPVDIDGERHLGAIAIDLTSEISGLFELQKVQEQRYSNEKLRALGELASGLAHDLGNNLNAARLRLDILRSKADPELIKDVDAAIRSINAAADRVRGVQNFVREGQQGELQSIDLSVLIREAIDMVDVVVRVPTVLGGRIRIECQLPDSLPAISGLATELKHVFANLLLNARDAMPEGGTITVCSDVTDVVEIVIADEGEGIPAEHVETIFKPFFTTKPSGSGLGLSMAKDVMTRHGGSISARNRAQAGAEFILRFPIIKS